ncbi:MAG: DUF4215 domain-containing protein [Deltaproteobacteria bacterium]|nr:DUF4215 domain-containing protein [Deltaproteobacteria bacterium]MBI3389303.1 DUF4215 domain-containing protein [Deltaproteobacteria bacterium]
MKTLSLVGLLIAIAAAGRSYAVAPPNDECTTPMVVSVPVFSDTIDTVDATAVASDPEQSCAPGQNSNSVWYSFIASADGTIVVNTDGSDYDTVLTAYSGGCGALTELTCDDDDGADPFTSVAALEVLAGQTILFEVTQFGDPGGGTVVFNSYFVAPATNDTCAAATLIPALPFADAVDTTAATSAASDPRQSCTDGPNANSVWYSFTASSNGMVFARTDGSDYDTVLTASSGACAAPTELACSDDVDPDVTSLVKVPVVAGQTVRFEVAQFDQPAGGTLVFHATLCGDGVLDPFEECDDGNAVNGDGCDSNCTLPGCGNGALSPGEQCDDGNSDDGDGCAADCTYELIPGDGYGVGSRDVHACLVEWSVVNPNNQPATDLNGRPHHTQHCKNNDSTCDFDGSATNDTCEFRVVACLNNVDPNLASCPQAGVADPIHVLAPTARDAANRASLVNALRSLRDPVTGATLTLPLSEEQTDACTAPFPIRVPLRRTPNGVRQKNHVRLITRSHSLANSPVGFFDSDLINLMCEP